MQVQSNGISLEVEERGPAGGEPLLLIMGLGMQLTSWPATFVRLLADAGYRVILFDNRDIGLSEKFEHWGKPDLLSATLLHAMRLKIPAPYHLEDMAADAVGVLDALGVRRCHVVGASMGGMIAQIVAVRYPERLKTLTLMMTTSGSRRLPGPTLKARSALLSAPRNPRDIESVIDHSVGILKVIGSPGYPTETADLRARLGHGIRRSYHPRGMGRQLLAVVAGGDRTPLLSKIRTPTLVIHGRQDPLVPVACGVDLARHIRGAQLELIDGLGHDLPEALLPRLTDSITRHAAK